MKQEQQAIDAQFEKKRKGAETAQKMYALTFCNSLALSLIQPPISMSLSFQSIIAHNRLLPTNPDSASCTLANKRSKTSSKPPAPKSSLSPPILQTNTSNSSRASSYKVSCNFSSQVSLYTRGRRIWRWCSRRWMPQSRGMERLAEGRSKLKSRVDWTRSCESICSSCATMSLVWLGPCARRLTGWR